MDHIDEETKRVDEEESGEMIVAGLNLVLIMSFLSLSAEDRSNFDQIPEIKTSDFDHKYKHGVSESSFPARRQRVNRFPAIERETTSSRVHTKIRDSRHCRRF